LTSQSHRLVCLALLFVLPAHTSAQLAITQSNIQTAVTAWLTNPATAENMYGPIANWDTAKVSCMANLFFPSNTARPTFNADISKWNVASVANMYKVCALVATQMREHDALPL
jgi:hypothetical protein